MAATDPLNEISIKVPAPFAGVLDLGFTAQYASQHLFEPSRDVPLLIEGPAPPLGRLANRLRLLREGAGGPYEWSDPIMLGDNVVVIAFRDRSLNRPGGVLADGARSSLDYVFNLVRPVVFPFLQDCAKLAQLRLRDQIEMRVSGPRRQIAELNLRLEQIVQPNGEDLLY